MATIIYSAMNHDEPLGTVRGRVEVLVLEDNPGDARLLHAELSAEVLVDLHLTVAPRLKDGLHLLSSREFDAVLLDLNLPDSHGMETFERLRAAVPELPLIVYTGSHDKNIELRALRGGAQDYLVKGPGNGPLLARAVHFAVERRRARAELDLRAARLEKNREALRRIVEASADVILILDRSGAVRFVNSGAEKMYGRSAADLVGQAGGFIIQPGTVEVVIPLPGGTVRTAEMRTVEIEWDEEPASLILLHDVTERKFAQDQVEAQNVVLEDQVRERTAELVAANSELEAFAYSVSHDLRAPLRSIDGFSQALLEDCEDKLDMQGKDYLIRIRAATKRMADLIEDLLQLSRLTRTEMNIEKINLTRIARSVIDELQKSHPQRHVEIKIGDGLEDTADSRLMRITLENLLGNAWKFTEKQVKAVIEFGCTEEGGKKVYFIRDNGVGFDMAYVDKLFAPFQRLHNEEEFPGTGIGLALVRRIIHRHGGKVWTEGQTDKGATFYFSLNEK